MYGAGTTQTLNAQKDEFASSGVNVSVVEDFKKSNEVVLMRDLLKRRAEILSIFNGNFLKQLLEINNSFRTNMNIDLYNSDVLSDIINDIKYKHISTFKENLTLLQGAIVNISETLNDNLHQEQAAVALAKASTDVNRNSSNPDWEKGIKSGSNARKLHDLQATLNILLFDEDSKLDNGSNLKSPDDLLKLVIGGAHAQDLDLCTRDEDALNTLEAQCKFHYPDSHTDVIISVATGQFIKYILSLPDNKRRKRLPDSFCVDEWDSVVSLDPDGKNDEFIKGNNISIKQMAEFMADMNDYGKKLLLASATGSEKMQKIQNYIENKLLNADFMRDNTFTLEASSVDRAIDKTTSNLKFSVRHKMQTGLLADIIGNAILPTTTKDNNFKVRANKRFFSPGSKTTSYFGNRESDIIVKYIKNNDLSAFNINTLINDVVLDVSINDTRKSILIDKIEKNWTNIVDVRQTYDLAGGMNDSDIKKQLRVDRIRYLNTSLVAGCEHSVLDDDSKKILFGDKDTADLLQRLAFGHIKKRNIVTETKKNYDHNEIQTDNYLAYFTSLENSLNATDFYGNFGGNSIDVNIDLMLASYGIFGLLKNTSNPSATIKRNAPQLRLSFDGVNNIINELIKRVEDFKNSITDDPPIIDMSPYLASLKSYQDFF